MSKTQIQKSIHLPKLAKWLAIACFFSLAPTFAEETQPGPACTEQLGETKVKIYIANFLVNYGKRDMGRLIADNIALKFEVDDRFDVVARNTINKQMSPHFKKELKPEEYFALAVSLAAEAKAECVVFGKIFQTNGSTSFIVKMVSVNTGDKLYNLEQDIQRKQAPEFMDKLGDVLVAFFKGKPAAAKPTAD